MPLIEVRITAPDAEMADRIARLLVEERLAACVQQLPRVVSTYRWEGTVERTQEVLLLAKTTVESFDALCAAVTTVHPYDVPEILAVPVSASLGEYRTWVEESVTG